MSEGEGRWARASLFYLAGYLSTTGVAFLIFPQVSLRILLAESHYDDVFVRFVGAFMVALSILVTQIIRLRLTVLHKTTLVVRIFFIFVISSLYFQTSDRLFLMILGVVTLGFILTGLGYLRDRNSTLSSTAG